MAFAALLIAVAASADPLAEPACRAAVEALSAREAAPADTAALRAAREAAARACLRTHADAPQPERRPQPPVAVPPALGMPPPLVPPPPRLPPPMPAPPPARPALPPPAVIGCDADSCLTSDGQRLQRSGSVLMGPQGLCRNVAGVLTCP